MAIYEVTVQINQESASTETKDELVAKFVRLIEEVNMTLNGAHLWVTDVSLQ